MIFIIIPWRLTSIIKKDKTVKECNANIRICIVFRGFNSFLYLFSVSSVMSLSATGLYKGYDRAFCVRMKSTLTKRGCHFKSSGYRVSEIALDKTNKVLKFMLIFTF